MYFTIRYFLRYKSLHEISEDYYEELNTNFGCQNLLISDFDSILGRSDGTIRSSPFFMFTILFMKDAMWQNIGLYRY